MELILIGTIIAVVRNQVIKTAQAIKDVVYPIQIYVKQESWISLAGKFYILNFNGIVRPNQIYIKLER